MNVFDHIYDYVHMVANECAPGVDFDENGEPYVCPSSVGFDVIRSFDSLEFPFTKEEYYNNTEVLEFLKVYEIDVEKFWYAILFIHHFTKSKIADGVQLAASPITQMQSMLDYFKNGKDVNMTITAKNKKRNLVIKNIVVFEKIADFLESNMPYLQENDHLYSRKWDSSNKSSVGKTASTQIAYATARYQALLDILITKGKRVRHTKMKRENMNGGSLINKGMTKGQSLSRLLFISRLMFFSNFTENEEYLFSEEPMNGVLKDYKNVEINTVSRKHIY